MPLARDRIGVMLVLYQITTQLTSAELLHSTCPRPHPAIPTGTPENHFIRYNSTSNTHSIICSSTNHLTAYLVCLGDRWLIAPMETSSMPDFTTCTPNNVIEVMQSQSRRMRRENSRRRRPTTSRAQRVYASRRGRSREVRSKEEIRRRNMAYCRRIMPQCPDCNAHCSARTRPMQLEYRNCQSTSSHYRARLRKVQTQVQNMTGTYQRCRYGMKLKIYELTKMKHRMGAQKNIVENLKNKINHQDDTIQEYKNRIETVTQELEAQRSMYSDYRSNAEYEAQQKEEEWQHQMSDVDTHCKQRVAAEREEAQQYKWELAEKDNLLTDEKHTSDYYKTNYDWCRDQLSNLGYK